MDLFTGAEDDPESLFQISELVVDSQLIKGLADTPDFLFSGLQLPEDIKPDICVSHEAAADDFFSVQDFSISSSEAEPTTAPSNEPNKPQTSNDNHDVFEYWDFLQREPLRQAQYLSWEAHSDRNYREPNTSYITEAGPSVFDAALASKDDHFRAHSEDCLILKMPIFVSSLLAMGLGRSSVLFYYNQDKQSFVPAASKMRVSGCTIVTIEELQSMFQNCGNLVRKLQSFVEKTYRQSNSSARIALADAVGVLLTSLNTHLSLSCRSATLLRAKELFGPAETLLVCFERLSKTAELAEDDEEVLSILFEEINALEHKADNVTGILSEVLSHVSRSFLTFAGEWLGIAREQNSMRLQKTSLSRSFVKMENRTWMNEEGICMSEPDYVLDTKHIPTFLNEMDSRVLFETGRSIRFLRDHHPHHPLASPDIVSSADPPNLRWEFSWHKLEEVEAKARKYEEDLTTALKNYGVPTPHKIVPSSAQQNTPPCESFNPFGSTMGYDVAEAFALAPATEHPLPILSTTTRLSKLLAAILSNKQSDRGDEKFTFAPPVSLVPSLSFSPLIAAQARVVNGASMRMFFQSHNIREHLSIQKRFQLLGDGVFSSRLSHALFDPDLETAERQTGVARSGGIMGLRLGGRDTWPPASSELRLALMGILTDSYDTSKSEFHQNWRKTELPGDLSFAVRDMSDAEIARCINPNSVEALDFLRLSYKPPAPLDTVITPMALFKYDQLFKLLLRVLRMIYAVSQLFRDATDRTSYWQGIDNYAQRFRIEAHHFVTCVSSYFFDVGIAATWSAFERKLDEVEAKVNSEDGFAALGQHEGIDGLRDYHEKIIDRIMFSLLLRKRQRPVMKVLEEIFALVLEFSRYSRSRALGLKRKVGQDVEVKAMYLKFGRKVKVFIDVCRGMSERKGFGERGNEGEDMFWRGTGGLFDGRELMEDNTIVQLLARLEMSGYYGK